MVDNGGQIGFFSSFVYSVWKLVII